MEVNGVFVPLEQSMTLLQLLEQNGYNLHQIAVERNETIVPKAAYAETVLSDTDVIEIVQFMGGGC